MPSEGSINISKGYYNNGTYEIFMPDSQVYLGTLKSGETVGCKNKTFAYSYNDVAGVKITADSNNDITTTHDVSVNLSHPIYLNYAKEYIVGDTPLESLGVTFSNGGYGTPDYTIVGSPTISSEYVLSNTSNSNYIKSNTTTPSSLTSFDIIMKYVKTDSVTSIRYLAADRNSNTVFYTENNKIGYYDPSNNNTIGTNTISLNTAYWIRWKLESGSMRIYKLLDNNYTLDTLPEISSWTLEATKNSFNTTYLQNKTIVIGAHPNTGTTGSAGNIYLADTVMNMNGEEWWRPIPVFPTTISTTTTGFVYNQTDDKTFWYPSTQTLLLEDFTALNDRCNLYLINNGNDPTGVLDVGTTSPSSVDSYLQQGYVYLNHANDKILGVGTEPDEIVLEATSSAAHYTVVGSPTIDSNNVASGFSSSSYLTFENPTTTFSSLEYNICITTPSSWSSSVDTMTLGINSSDFTGFMIAFGTGHSSSYQAGKMLLFVQNVQGSSWTDTGNMSYTFSTNTKYYIRIAYNSGSWTISYSTNGISYTQIGTLSKSLSLPSTLLIGNSTGSWGGNNPFMGSIHLADTYMLADGVEVWRAIGGSLDTITVDPVHNWSYYGLPTNPKINPDGTPDNYDYLGSTAQFDLDEYNDVQTIASSNPDMENQTEGYIYIMTQADRGNLFIAPKDNAIGLNGDYYTGYKIEFTDDTFAEIASLTKTGTKVRLYAAATNTTLHNYTIAYIAVTKAQYEGGISTGDVVYYGELYGQSMSMMLTEMTELKTVGTNINYDSSTDTFSYGNWEAIYIGDFYVDLV